jgi:Arc/MetJ-type ribon-helix-helix transcriptional regulator
MSTPTTTIRLPTELREQIRQYARSGNKSNTEVIIEALRAFFEQQSASARDDQVERELARLAEIDKADPDLDGFYEEPETDPFGGKS